MLAAADSAHAQSIWLGITANYRANANWDNATPPVIAGRSAIFTNTGASTSVNITTAPGPVTPDSWTFISGAQNYTFTGADVHFSVAGPTGGIISNANAGQTITIKNNIGESVAGVTVQVLGASTLFLTAANTYSGGTTALGGTIEAAKDTSFGTGLITLDAATLKGDGTHNINIANLISVNNTLAPTNTFDNTGKKLTLSGDISGAGGAVFTDSSPGAPFGGRIVLSGTNTYTGGTTVVATTVQANNGNVFGSGNVTLDLGTVQTKGSNLTLTNDFILANTTNFGGFTGGFLDANGATLRINGKISGAGTLETIDSAGAFGTVVLAGINTYTGGTIVCSCSTLQIGTASRLGSIIGPIDNEGVLKFVNADTSGITTLKNEGGALTSFHNATNAGTMTINNLFDPFFGPSTLRFHDSASAGSATINNSADAFSPFGSLVVFSDKATAGKSTINNGDSASFGSPSIKFNDDSTAGEATINNLGFGSVTFSDKAVAGSATINNNDAGILTFKNHSSAGNATIVNNADGSFGGIDFLNHSNAGNAFITTSNGALTRFFDHSDGGTARFETASGGIVDFSGSNGLNSNGRIKAGSIAGAGTYYIGAGNTLSVGGNNLSTEVNGVIADFNPCGCGPPGPGTLEKVGTGTLTLSGMNTYSGGTTLIGGAVSVSQEANLGALSGALTFNGGTLQVTGTSFNATTRAINWGTDGGAFDIANAANSFAVGPLIGSGGALTKFGPGTLVLTGANTYTGGTTIAGGTLSISANNNIGTGPLAMLNGTILTFTNGFTFSHPVAVAGDPTFNVTGANTVTMAAPITDGVASGDLVKTGTGTLVLTAANTYTGGTTISAGTLQLGNSGTTGSVVGNVLDNANFAINRSDTFSFGGQIAGSGAFDQKGTGTTIFTANNTYTGGTLISGGALQLGDGGATGWVVGDVVDNGTLAFNRSDAVMFGGMISGTGTVKQIGTGTLTLSGVNTYTGPTIVDGGMLAIASTGSITSTVTNNSLFLNAGVVTGNLINNGLSSNTGTITGTATINSGFVSNDGTIAGIVTVNPDGTLAGNGTIGAGIINGGTVSPGHSIGTITVTGNLTFIGPGNYIVEVSPTGADRVNVGGTASLSATLSAIATGGAYTIGTKYLVLNSGGGVSGTFGNIAISGNFGVTKPHLEYDANNVFLVLGPNAISPSLTGGTSNQKAVAGAVDSALQAGNQLATFDALFSVATAQLPQALDTLSGEVHASTAGVLMDESLYLRSAVLGRLRQASYGGNADMAALSTGGPQLALADDALVTLLAYGAKSPLPTKAPRTAPAPSRDIAFWSQGFGAWGKFNGDGNAAAVRRDLAGFFTGVDARFGNWRGGIAAGYTASRNNLEGRGNANVETGHLAAYSGSSFGAFNLRGGAAYAWHTIDTSRTVALPGFFDTPTGHYNGATGQVFGEAGYGMAFGKVAVEPFAGAAWVHLHTDPFNERGGAAALHAAANAFEVGYSTLGVRAASAIPLWWDMLLVPRVSVAWQHAFNNVTPTDTLAFQGLGAPFVVAGVPIARDSLLSEAGLDLVVSRNVTLGVSYTGQLARNVHDHAAKGKFTWKF